MSILKRKLSLYLIKLNQIFSNYFFSPVLLKQENLKSLKSFVCLVDWRIFLSFFISGSGMRDFWKRRHFWNYLNFELRLIHFSWKIFEENKTLQFQCSLSNFIHIFILDIFFSSIFLEKIQILLIFFWEKTFLSKQEV